MKKDCAAHVLLPPVWKTWAQDCFKDSVQIVDFYHALAHECRVLDALLGKNHADHKTRQRRWAKRLLKVKVQSLIEEARPECMGQSQAPPVEDQLGYCQRNIQRIHSSHRSESFCRDRLNQHANSNDNLSLSAQGKHFVRRP